jgi:hypothetical protein
MNFDRDMEERLFPVAGRVLELMKGYKDEDWQTKFLIASVFFHRTCTDLGISKDAMCGFIAELDDRWANKRKTQ